MNSLSKYKEKDKLLFESVRRFLAGDDSRANEIYELSEKYIYACIYQIEKNPTVIEDLMQEAYLQIFNKLNTLQEPESFYVWAGRVATTQSFRYLKKNGRDVLAWEDENGDTDWLWETAQMDKEPFIPETVIVQKETQRLIADIVDGLSPMQKVTVQYYYYDEMSVNDIAKAMNCSVGTVKSRLNYARNAIKNAVIDLDVKQGTRLYSLAAMPLFLMAFRLQAEELVLDVLAGGVVSGGAIGGGSSVAEAVGGGSSMAEAVGGGSSMAEAVGGGSSVAEAVVGGSSAVGMTTTGATVTAAAAGSKLIAGIVVAITVTAVSVTTISSVVSTRQSAPAVMAPAAEAPAAPTEKERQELLAPYAAMLDAYEAMGIEREVMEERMLESLDVTEGSTEQEAAADIVELYEAYNEFCVAYEQLKSAHQSCLSSDQYAVMEREILSICDQAIAYETMQIQQMEGFMKLYGGEPEAQEWFRLTLSSLQTTTKTLYASAELLRHPLSADILSTYSASDVQSYLSQGVNIPTLIQMHIIEYNEAMNGAYNDMVDTSNNLAMESQNLLSIAEELLTYTTENTVLLGLMEEYQQNMSEEDILLNQQITEYYNSLLQ